MKPTTHRLPRRRIGRRSHWESGQASVELVIMIGPVFLTLFSIISVVFYNAYVSIALTTAANDCAQVASQNVLTTWIANEGTEAFSSGRDGFGVGPAQLIDSPVRPEMGANALHSVSVVCSADIPGREIVEGLNESTIYRRIVWPLQSYRSCYDESQPALLVGDFDDPATSEPVARECGPN